MNLPNYSRQYERWTPFVARVMFAGLFLYSSYGKIPGTETFAMEAGFTAAAGVPFAQIAVILALLTGLVGSVSFILGWHTRASAFFLAGYVGILTLVFHRSVADPMAIGQLLSHLGLIAGLLYISVYGAQSLAIKKDSLPMV